MKKLFMALALTACLLTPLAVQAQPGGRPGGPGGPGGMHGMRNNSKMRLGGFFRGVEHLERNKTNALSSAQAKSVVQAVKPWASKSRMSESEAKNLLARLSGILTAKQKSEIEKSRSGGPLGERRGDGRRGEGRRAEGGRGEGRRGEGGRVEGRRGDRPRGDWGGRPGGPDGGGTRPSEAQMRKVQNFMKNYNPLYPPTKYAEVKQLPERMREGFTRRYREQQETMNALSRKAR